MKSHSKAKAPSAARPKGAAGAALAESNKPEPSDRDEWFASVVASLEEGVVVQDADGRILTANASAERILGLSLDQMAGRTSLDPRWRTVHEDGSPLPGEDHPAMVTLRTGLPLSGAIMGVHRPDGTLRWISINSQPLQESGDRPRGVVTSFFDITDLKRMETDRLRLIQEQTALAESEAASVRVRNILESIADAFFALDRDWHFTYVNREAERVLRRKKEALLGRTVWECFPEAVDSTFYSEYHRALTENVTVEIEEYYPPLKIWFNVRAYPSPEGLAVYFRDVTERKRVEQALRDRDEQLRLSLRSAQSGLWSFDFSTGDGTFTDEWKRVMGYPPDAPLLSFEEWLSRVKPDDRPRLTRLANEKIESGGRDYSLEFRIDHPELGERWMLSRGRIFPSKAGPAPAMQGIVVDITDRRRVEEAEHEQRELARTLRAANEALTQSLELKTVLERLLEHLARLVPYDSANVMLLDDDGWLRVYALRGYEDWSEPDSVRRIRLNPSRIPNLRTLIATRRSAIISNVDVYPDWQTVPGTAHVRSWIGVPLLVGGEVLGLYSVDKAQSGFFTDEHLNRVEAMAAQAAVAVHNARLFEAQWRAREAAEREVVERKRAEATLRESEARLRALLESLDDLVVEYDASGTMLNLWTTNDDLLVRPKDEQMGRHIAEALGEELGRRFLQVFERVLDTGRPETMEYPVELPDGTHWFAARINPIPSPEGGRRTVAVLSRDITEKRRLDDELARASKLESIGVLAGGIAHDFNNLLTAILTNISLAKLSAADTDPSHRRLVEAEKATLRARDLTQQLLTFSRGGEPVLKLADVSGLLQEAATFALRGSNVQPRLSIAPNLWPAEVDEGQIAQVIHNLVLNAQQATPQGGTVWVEAQNTVLSPAQGLPLDPGPHLKIMVSDEGVGIPEEHLTRIFDPFYTTKSKGSGLGLATTHAIVHKHGGHIAVHSKSGVGTTFVIHLPALPDQRPESTESVVCAVPGKGRVLIMDDESTVLDALNAALTTLGYEVSAARDGAEAVEFFRQARDEARPYNVVLLDLTVPGGMGGREAVEKMRALDPRAKAIVSSGYSSDPVMAHFRVHGFHGVIAKPYNLEELSQLVHRVIHQGD